MRLPPHSPRALALMAVLAAGLAASVSSAKGPEGVVSPRDEDEDDRAFRRESSRRLVRENCLICHSEELISASRLTPKQWKAEVEKMIGWGTPLSKGEVQPVIDYLAAEYPADSAPARPARQTFREATRALQTDSTAVGAAPGDPGRGATRYARDCANCHGPDGQGAELGPNLVEKPVLWRVADYAEVVHKGRGRMPGFATLYEKDQRAEADLLAWLRARRYHATIPAK